MRGDNRQLVVMTCKYHNGRYGYYDPHSSRERIMAIGELGKGYLIIRFYTSYFKSCGGRCIGCSYCKIYSIDRGKIRERNASGKFGVKLKMCGEEVSYEKIEEEAKKLGFPLY